jgi:hypothetical protein
MTESRPFAARHLACSRPFKKPVRRCDITRLRENPKIPLANQICRDSSPDMIRCGFLDPDESRSELIALLHRLGMAHRRPQAVSSKLDPDKQAAFIKGYETLLKQIGDDEAVLFADADATFADFTTAILTFLHEELPRRWGAY